MTTILKKKLSLDVMKIDCQKEVARICIFIQEYINLSRKKGAVIGLSGGIDSALMAALCVQALGSDKVLGVILPERESDPKSKTYALRHAKQLGIKTEVFDISRILESIGTYDFKERIIKKKYPDFDSTYKYKLAFPEGILESEMLSFYKLLIENSEGIVHESRINKEDLLAMIAATNTKQRTRMLMLNYYAEKMEYFVCGTTNRTEFIQGFFVKHGDGGVDAEPILHLYKTQVYHLSDHMEILPEIINRAPTPDTFSLPVSDEEMFFRIPFDRLDLLLYAWQNTIPHKEVCKVMKLEQRQVERAFKDFDRKSRLSKYHREQPASLL